MEKQIQDAKAVQVRFSYDADKNKTKGELLVSGDNKGRLKVTSNFGGKRPSSFEVVADGATMRSKGAKLYVMPSGLPAIEPSGSSEWKQPKKLHAFLTASVTRGGMWFTVFTMPYLSTDSAFNPDGDESRMKTYDFTLAGTEKVGGRDAKILRYRFGKGDSCPHDEEITLWIDAQTLLPLKRSFTLKIEQLRVSETYESFTLDPKIEADAFKLPK